MPRYAVLHHDWPEPHFDLFLEADGVLRAWKLFGDVTAGAPVRCEPAADHRMLYLEYEGPVPGGRGAVKRVAAGTFEWLEAGAVAALDVGELTIRDGTAVLASRPAVAAAQQADAEVQQ